MIFDMTKRKGGSPVPQNPTAGDNDIIFIDYDGTIRYSYTKAEFAQLSELPPNPNHTDMGLVAEGWNWTLAGAKAYVAKYKQLVIGQVYRTSDGNTHLGVDIPETRRTIKLAFYSQTNNNEGTIAWGDGTTEAFAESSNNKTYVATHTYVSRGSYDISITSNKGITPQADMVQTPNGQYICLLNYIYLGNKDRAGNAPNRVKILTIPSTGFSSLGNMFRYLNAFAVIFPKDYTASSGNSNWFQSNSVVQYVSWGENCNVSVRNYNYTDCVSLRRISIDARSTTTASGVFLGCRTLTRIDVPETLETIGAECFKNCYGLTEVHFYALVPPTINNSNAFAGLPTDCTIYVPAGKLNDYKTASNFPDPNTYTYAEESQ